MKLFSLFSLGAMAAETGLSRNRRETEFTFTGEESVDFFNEFLAELTDGTTDELDQLIFNLSGGEQSRFISEVESRKFRQLKVVVLWLQKEQKFGRYCYYGCYCLPEGSHNIAGGGYGKPKDNIDRSCKDFKQCYHCLKNEYDGERSCIGEEVGYGFQLLEENGVKTVRCTNREGSCRRNVCECDLALAKGLSKFEDEWEEKYHSVKGGFNRTEECIPGGGGNGYNPAVGCCGDKTTFPFNEIVRANQCCDGPFAKPAGQCY